jgi:hypothetical protein
MERFGRRWPLIIGGLWQSAWLFVFAAVGTTKNPETDPSAGTVMIVSAALFIFGYAMTWAPGVWIIIGETFPTRTRAKQAALSTASNWLWNFLLVRVFLLSSSLTLSNDDDLRHSSLPSSPTTSATRTASSSQAATWPARSSSSSSFTRAPTSALRASTRCTTTLVRKPGHQGAGHLPATPTVGTSSSRPRRRRRRSRWWVPGMSRLRRYLVVEPQMVVPRRPTPGSSARTAQSLTVMCDHDNEQTNMCCICIPSIVC